MVRGCVALAVLAAGCAGPSPPPSEIIAPAVAGLPAPPPDVLRAQAGIAIPDGFLRTGDGRIWCSKDGAEMVLVPAGEFTMGDDSTEQFDHEPARRVSVPGYLMDRHEVTNAQFARFVAETGYRTDAERGERGRTRQGGGSDWRHPEFAASSIEGKEAHPVVQVSWNDAMEYCRWAGKRLPTEAEFEKALRGGLEGARFPWGDDAVPKGRPGNYCPLAMKKVQPDYDDGYPGSSPAGAFDQSPLGFLDISGNAWEWCSDGDDNHAVVRGGGMAIGDPVTLRCAYRSTEIRDDRWGDLGFRCARSVP